jgi:hypothetical protein
MPRTVAAQGIVSIIDALGTKLFSQTDADKFLGFRDSITKFNLKVFETNRAALRLEHVQTFTIGDTIIYAYVPPHNMTLQDVERFSHVMRIAVSHSIEEGFPVRGAFAIGKLYRDADNAVLGPAVTDAASWFEQADWIGVHATPHASLKIQSRLELRGDVLSHVLVDYPVPMKDATKPMLKCVNWPKAYFVEGLRPVAPGNGRSRVMSAFAKRQIPRGTQQKYTNALDFYDVIERTQKLEQQYSAHPSPAPPDSEPPDSEPLD